MGPSNHRCHGKIPVPSYSGDIIPAPFLNVVKTPVSLQDSEKQGDNQLERLQARDLLPSEVQSLVTENDLEEIEEKIIS